MEYTNYLTTPSGRYCQVKDITNGQYLILVKFLQAGNIKKFFECLDQIVKKSIPDFDDYDVAEKCYVYIAMCMYSIRAFISVNNKMIGSQQVSMATILNNIESSYTRDFICQYQLKEGVVLKFGYPKRFNFQGETPVIDYFSGLKGYNNVELNQVQVKQLKAKIGTKTLMFIDDYLRDKCSSVGDLFHGVPMNSFEMDILSQSMVANVVGFFKMPLDTFYHVMYAMIKHLRMSYSDFLKISQLEANIMMKICAEENEKLNEETKKSGGMNMTAMREMAND